MSQPPQITAAQSHAIAQIAHLENYTKVAIVALGLLLAATVVFTLLGLCKKTPMCIPAYTFVTTAIPLAALKIIEMQKQTYADSIGQKLSWCLAVLRGYPEKFKPPDKGKEKPDEVQPP